MSGKGSSGSSVSGFLPCFSKHIDHKFPLTDLYANSAFVLKVEVFMQAIITSPSTQILNSKIHAKGGIQPIDPNGNRDDRNLCQLLGWQTSKIYRVDYGDNPYRLLFGLDNVNRRCYVLALDSTHKTRPGKKK
jgi:hypothetical protein